MGRTFSKLLDSLFYRNNNNGVRILMVGLDYAGKTTILFKLKRGEVVQTIATLGYNVETIEHNDVRISIWDVSGVSGIRPLWRHYFENTRGLIFVIDSTDRDRINEARDELIRLLNENELRDVPFLVLANKQDLPGAMDSAEISEKICLYTVNHCNWHIQSTCAISGDGLYEGLDWLSTKIGSKKC